jgi:hypothetical protein
VVDELEGLRPEVVLFARMMERELKANDHKGGWKGCSPHVMFTDLLYHVAKLGNALVRGQGAAMAEHSADVANIAMMVADTAGLLNDQTEETWNCSGCGVPLVAKANVIRADESQPMYCRACWEARRQGGEQT